MATSALYTPARRASRVVPYMLPSPPTEPRKHWGALRHQQLSVKELERRAYGRGLFMGQTDRHSEDRDFRTGCEWRAWLRGWRRGQRQLKAERAREWAARVAEAAK